MTKNAQVKKAVETLKTVGNLSRFKILALLRDAGGEMCVSDISFDTQLSQSLTSHQLSRLEDKGIISSKRIGQSVCYRLTDSPLTKRVLKIIKELY